MATATAPIKVDAETDHLISHLAHFLGSTKKQIVNDAVRGYADTHRDEVNARVREALAALDGTNAAVVSLVTGLTRDELEELGGVSED